MINFCTLFDSNYLTRGLALYQSLRKVCPAFHLYVVAFNEDCFNYLNSARLPNLTPIALGDFEDESLLEVKPFRSAAEYCWTCTPSIILYSIKKYNLPSCTYVDADMVFYDNPQLLFNEMNDCSVLITEHRYTKDYDQSKLSGKYCVQFMYFRNTEEGMNALKWWRERCIEWCYARSEDGKFGDQKYLDDWTERFKKVHVLQNPGGGVAPWNIQQYDVNISGNSILLKEKCSGKTYPLVFFHFHGVKFYTNQQISCCGPIYGLDSKIKELIYLPYFRTLLELQTKLENEGISFNINGARTKAPSKFQVFLQFLKEKLVLWKIGNITLFQLDFYNFKKHYHFYTLKNLK